MSETTIETVTKTVSIGWTTADRTRFPDYMPFWDTYRPGLPQHVETVTIEVPKGWDARRIAEAAYTATNHPEPTTLGGPARAIYERLRANGYHGRQAHWSLSVGDTVTVDDVRLGCARIGWEEV